jgi:hypothetical protein
MENQELPENRRDVLMRAAMDNDFDAIRDRGWWPVYTGLSSWWNRRFEVRALIPFADLLADEDPQAIVAALRALVGGDWPPGAADVYRQVQSDKAAAAQERDAQRPRRGRPDLERSALIRVKFLIDKGERVCACVPRSGTMSIDAAGVIRCPYCEGIDPGQADESMGAEDDLGPARIDFAALAAEVQAERVAGGKAPSMLLTRLAGGAIDGQGGGSMLKRMPEVDDADRQREAETLGRIHESFGPDARPDA